MAFVAEPLTAIHTVRYAYENILYSEEMEEVKEEIDTWLFLILVIFMRGFHWLVGYYTSN